MTRPRLSAILVSTFVGVLVAVASPAAFLSSAASAPPECRWGARGLVENRWLGGTGSWSDVTRWSRGVAPGIAARDYACIPQGSHVVVDTVTSRVDLDVLELGKGSRLTLAPGTAMFVWGDQDDVRSITKRDSVIEVDGATLGGGGRLHVIGTVDVHRSSTGAAATLTTHPGSSSYSGPDGILEIGDEGTLDVRGSGDVRIAEGYVVDVHGRARLRDDAGLVADHGTSFLLQQHYFGKGVGRLVILNDHGFAEGQASDGERLATFVNRGRIVKRDSTGTSRIEASYLDAGEVREKSGVIELPEPVVMSPPAQDPCDDASSCDPLQTAVVRLPDTDPDGADVVIEPLEGESAPGAIGVPIKVHAIGMQATIADPAVIRLRYDLALFEEAGIPPNPTQLLVGHADGPDDKYADIPRCVGRGLPLGAIACLDVRASEKDAGDLVLVVRAIETSRWVAH
jgi:hypothetical protein